MSDIAMKLQTPSEPHLRMRNLVLALIQKEATDMPAEEILALLSYTVGQLIAFQDQRRFTPDMAMAIVQANIEAGNRQAMEGVLQADTTKRN